MLYRSHWKRFHEKAYGKPITLAGTDRWQKKKYKVDRNKKQFLIFWASGILKSGEPTYFEFEGTCRTGIRRALVLTGWPWAQADSMAAQLTKTALNIIGATRPTWQQGQPEWTQPGALPIKRERCKNCSKPIPEDHRLFCSNECVQFYHQKKRTEMRQSERMVIDKLEAIV